MRLYPCSPDGVGCSHTGVIMTPFYIIDGYNLLHQIGVGRRLSGPGNLGRARYAMIQSIAKHFSPTEQSRIAIVFDAAEARPQADSLDLESANHKMVIHYAAHFDNADEMIEALVSTPSAPRQLTVVSSDRAVQQSAKRRSATFMDSLEWYELLPTLGHQDAVGPDSPPTDPIDELRQKPLDENDRNYWLREFGLDPE